ncbi:hypothetical protein [Mycolicibacterium aubagnense]|uniref:Uncharacterized protein n=1 Tax=Mycolicibacterium aubagnense TaxID=319707 RepID=A0ABN5YKG0_9MYCO|nr:hypothetical protein [Mycolicibacterium aubagnense]TLH64425.1 hypothetical protein C1S80_12120 [Mycolicibacterium aubagnense]BBX82156.1 hypothetical protein MAUB_00290 [Mycolicibacterium aubagnense]
MGDNRRIRRNDLVRIGSTGRKVYRVEVSTTDRNGPTYYLEADADHPDAAKRLPDAFRWYRREELTGVSRG